MSTYEEMQIILTIALLIVAILSLKNKKEIAVLFFGETDDYSLKSKVYAGSGESHSPSGSLVKHIICHYTFFFN